MQEYRASISAGVKHLSVSEVATYLANISCESHLRQNFLLIFTSLWMQEHVPELRNFNTKGINIAV